MRHVVPTLLWLPLALSATACGGGGEGAEPTPAPALEFTSRPVPVGIGPVDVRVADLDCDGRLDLVAFCPGDSSLSVRRGLPGGPPSNPSYGPPLQTLVPDSTRDFCVADLDGDGRPDLVAITGDPDFDLVAFHNTGAAEVLFNPREYTITKAAATRVAAGDVDGDGHVDLVLLDETTGAVALLPNDPASPGDFLLTAVQLPSFDGACRDLAVGDLDGDGLLDVMTLTEADGAFAFLSQGPPGTYRQKKWLTSNFRTSMAFAIGDMDGDGRLDVVRGRSIPENSVEYGTLFQDPGAPEGFRESPTLTSAGATRAMRLADMNRDGLLDLVATEADTAGRTSVTLHLGDASSPARMKKGTVKFFNETKGFGRALAVADLDGDGFPDVVTGDASSDVLHVHVRVGAPPAPPTFVRTRRLDAPDGAGWATVQVGDLDGDGRDDLVVGGSDGITVFPGDPASSGAFLPGETTPVGVPVTDLRLADVDRDGRLDVAFAGSGAAGDVCGVLWKRHDVPGFDAPTSIPVESADGVAVGDVNGDGLPDLLCTVRKHEAAMAAIQNTRRTFAPGFEVQAGGPCVALALADLDCDGRLDVATANADDTLSVLLHAPGFPPPGPGLLLAPQVTPFAGGVRVAVGDLDGDGRADLVTADATGVTISTHESGDGSTNQWPARVRLPVGPLPPGDPDFDLLVLDVDRDGRLDIVFGGADAEAFRVLRSDPSAPDGFRTHPIPHILEVGGTRVAVGDVNGDSWSDVVTLTGAAPGATGGGHVFVWTQVPGPR